jgi:uncharacterized membrane protein
MMKRMSHFVIVHIAASLLLAFANIGALSLTILARRSRSPKRVLALLRIHNVFAAKLLVPSAVVTLATGAWLTHSTGASLLAPWMVGTLILFLGSALVGITYLLPAEALATTEAKRLVAVGASEVSTTLVRHTAATGIVVAEWTAQVTMVAMFVLMICRPG